MRSTMDRLSLTSTNFNQVTLASIELGCLFCTWLLLGCITVEARPVETSKWNEVDRSPVDCVLSQDDKWLFTANQTSGTISVISLAENKVIQEIACGQRPSNLAITPDGKMLLASASFSHEVVAYSITAEGKLEEKHRLWLGFEPRGIVIDAAGKLAYIALSTAHTVAVVELDGLKEQTRIPVGRWPRTLALTPDEKTLVVTCSGNGSMSFVNVAERKLIRNEPFNGLNQGQLVISSDGEFAYTPYIYHFGSAPNQRTIKLGWVTTSRIARIRINSEKRISSLYLDTQGQAVADPCGLAISPNQEWMACSASGTHEVLFFRNSKLPFQGFNSRFLIDEDLRTDSQRYFRLPVGGRPMYIRFSKDCQRLFVANYLLNAIQVIDVASRTIERTISLGGPATPSLAREGEAIFYDGMRSFDQWYSCASCHHDGHSNGIAMDTTNDGQVGNPKMVPSMRYVSHTGPWTWHGWQEDIGAAMRKSMKESMLGKPMSDHEVKALVAYLETLSGPTNPHRGKSGQMSEAMLRGKEVFESSKAGCANCHRGEYLTDNKVHEVGLESRNDYYQGFNPPTLRGVYDRMSYLHDGRARTLEELLAGPHAPEKVTGNGKLTNKELQDLLEYLKGL